MFDIFWLCPSRRGKATSRAEPARLRVGRRRAAGVARERHEFLPRQSAGFPSGYVFDAAGAERRGIENCKSSDPVLRLADWNRRLPRALFGNSLAWNGSRLFD